MCCENEEGRGCVCPAQGTGPRSCAHPTPPHGVQVLGHRANFENMGSNMGLLGSSVGLEVRKRMGVGIVWAPGTHAGASVERKTRGRASSRLNIARVNIPSASARVCGCAPAPAGKTTESLFFNINPSCFESGASYVPLFIKTHTRLTTERIDTRQDRQRHTARHDMDSGSAHSHLASSSQLSLTSLWSQNTHPNRKRESGNRRIGVGTPLPPCVTPKTPYSVHLYRIHARHSTRDTDGARRPPTRSLNSKL
jgi:hypothetical protein